MSSRDIDFSDYHKVAPIGEEPPRQRGCLFYGCIIAAVLSVLLMVAVGVFFYVVYRWVGTLVEQYTSTAPRALPAVTMPAEQRVRVRERVDAFKTGLKEERPTPPLVLTAADINALIDETPQLKGRFYVEIVGDKMKGQVSIPLDDFPSFGLTRGRYLNGEAEFSVGLTDGIPMVTISALEVNGKTAPEEAMAGIRGQNILRNMKMDAETAAQVNKFERIEIKDGTVVITPRAPSGKETEPGTAGGRTATDAFPDDVLAPPGSRPAVPIEPAAKP